MSYKTSLSNSLAKKKKEKKFHMFFERRQSASMEFTRSTKHFCFECSSTAECSSTFGYDENFLFIQMTV